MPAAPTRPEPPEAGERPVCERGDVIFCKTALGKPFTGKVMAHGKHGVTVENGGKPHKVRWEHVLGHKERVQPEFSIVDEGEDGFLAKDRASGRVRYVHDPLTTGEEDLTEPGPLTKALALAGRLEPAPSAIEKLMALRDEEALAKALKNGPGLALQPVTDKAGHQTKRWKRTAAEEKKGRKAAAPKLPPGHEHAAPGDKVKFKAGDFEGSGTLHSFGSKGAWVVDGSGRPHKVDWSEVHERETPEPAAAHGEVHNPGADSEKPAEKKPEKPDPKRPFYSPEEHAAVPHGREVRQPHNDEASLYAAARPALAQFKSALRKVSNQLKLRTDVQLPEALTDEHVASRERFMFVAPLKSTERAREKVASDYDGDWNKLKDIVRATISVNSMEEIHQAVAAVKAAGLQLAAQPKNGFEKPSAVGYRDLNVLVKLKGGMVGELQFHVKHMTAAKNEGHKHYEVMRSLEAKYNSDTPTDSWSTEDHSAYYGAMSASKAIYDEAWNKSTSG